MNIILHSDDLVLSDYWKKSISQECTSIDTLSELERVTKSLIIFNVSACTPMCKKFLKQLKSNDNRVLVLHRTPSLNNAKEFLKNGADGYGNALMREHFLNSAIYTIEENMVWLYPELTSEMITDLPSSDEFDENKLSELTSREREVAILLKDGDTYKNVALKLDITARTVKAHAGHIYTKLNVKDRLGLALLLK